MWRWIIGILAALAVMGRAILFNLPQVFSSLSGSVAKVIPKGWLVQTTLAQHVGSVEAEAVILQAGVAKPGPGGNARGWADLMGAQSFAKPGGKTCLIIDM